MSLDDDIRAALNHPALVAQREDEKRLVRELGDRIGYGRMMQLAERLWRQRLVEQGIPGGGEHSVGPCVAFLVPCPCLAGDGPVKCDWCCGAGRVTERVATEARKLRNVP